MNEPLNKASGLTVRGIKKSFGINVVLKGIDLQVPQGSVVALIGGNGAGKSTLMKIVMGIYQADDVALEVQDVVVGSAVVLQDRGIAVGVVEEVQDVVAVGFPQEGIAGVIVGVGYAVCGFGGADAISSIVVADIGGSVGCRLQPSAVAPGEGPAISVVVAGGVACVGVGIDLCTGAGAPKAPLCKGSWQNRLTGAGFD